MDWYNLLLYTGVFILVMVGSALFFGVVAWITNKLLKRRYKQEHDIGRSYDRWPKQRTVGTTESGITRNVIPEERRSIPLPSYTTDETMDIIRRETSRSFGEDEQSSGQNEEGTDGRVSRKEIVEEY